MCIKYSPDLIEGLYQSKFVEESVYITIKDQLINTKAINKCTLFLISEYLLVSSSYSF